MGLDPLITTLRAKIRRVDGEILAAVRQQSANGGCSRWLNCAFLRADLLAVTWVVGDGFEWMDSQQELIRCPTCPSSRCSKPGDPEMFILPESYLLSNPARHICYR